MVNRRALMVTCLMRYGHHQVDDLVNKSDSEIAEMAEQLKLSVTVPDRPKTMPPPSGA